MVAILLGGTGIMSISFWWAVGFVYAGLFMLGVDVCLEPSLKKHIGWRTFAICCVVGLSVAFSRGVVFVASPLAIEQILDADYTPGKMVNGLRWREGFTRATFIMSNKSDHEYRDVTIFIRSNLIFVRVNGAPSGAKCETHRIFDIYAAKQGRFNSSGETYDVQEIPDLVMDSNIIRITCDVIPKGEMFAIDTVAASDRLTEQMSHDDKINQLNFDATYKGWMGKPEKLKQEVKLQ
jgi:hypothetical protein